MSRLQIEIDDVKYTIKECPFCGSDDMKLQRVRYGWFVGCRESACFITGKIEETAIDALNFWNTRPINTKEDKHTNWIE